MVPCLPACVVSECLLVPRRVPYLLLRKQRRSGELKEVVRLASPYRTSSDWLSSGWAELKCADGSKVICNHCQKPRCALYGWEINEVVRNVRPAGWLCRECSGLSYASEGQALHIRCLLPDLKQFSHLLRKSRPDPWQPLVFVSPWAAVDAGLCRLNQSDNSPATSAGISGRNSSNHEVG